MKEFLHTLFATRRVAFYLNLLGLTLAFVIFYVLMAEVKWVNTPATGQAIMQAGHSSELLNSSNF